MKKSKSVPATVVAAVAAMILTGCHSNPTEVRRCIDAKGNVIPDTMCSTGGSMGGSSYYGSHWVYGGSMSGSRLGGYHSSPSSGASISDGSGHSVSRGGFGSHGSGGSGGAGGEGGGRGS
jgi:hypothetical protein